MGVFAVQAFLVFFNVDIPVELFREKDTSLAPGFLTIHFFHKPLIKVVLIIVGLYSLVLIGDPDRKKDLLKAFTNTPFQFSVKLMCVQFVCFLILLWLSSELSRQISIHQQTTWMMDLGWLFVALIFSFASMFLFASARFYRWFLLNNIKVLLVALLATGLILFWSFGMQNAWDHLAKYTLDLVVSLLSLFYSEVTYVLESQTVGVRDFTVIINRLCSGYEGVGLVSSMLMIYLWLFRRQFRFPNALILIPIGICAIWLINVVRIAILVVIGAELSPEIAIGGFHSHAGWLAFLLVTFVVLYFGGRVSFVRAPQESVSKEQVSQGALTSSQLLLATVLLVPFIVLLLSTLLTGLISADFQWAYPLRVILVMGALVVLWPQMRIGLSSFQYSGRTVFIAISVGIVAFLIWIALVDNDPVRSQLFAETLFGASEWAALTWLVFRIIGSCITVPIAEEFAFRGYFLARLSGVQLSFTQLQMTSVFAIASTSLAFGLLHNAWLAGAIVGSLYAMVRIYGGHLFLAVLSHSITNMCLCVYVIYTQSWSLL